MSVVAGKMAFRSNGRNQRIADETHEHDGQKAHHDTAKRLFLTFQVEIKGGSREDNHVRKVNDAEKIGESGADVRLEQK